MDSKVYREFILNLNRNPKNKERLSQFDIKEEGLNPHCGDKIELFLELEEGKINKVGWEGVGCAISQAASSLFTEEIKQKNINQVKAFNKNDMLDLLEIPIDYTREKCALLAFSTAKKALSDK
ncbi:MAG: iron-sulfur cluster assembly scaffold protein [Candidatus Paceibacteria bacterium]